MVFIIAEIGINHNGDVNLAKKLIDLAVDSGCDAVKFQKRSVEDVYDKEFLDSPRDSPWGTTQRDQKLGLELSLREYAIIDKYCKKKKIDWFVSCWDTKSQLAMRRFKTKYNKIASAMLTHNQLVKLVAEERKYTFISTGMSTMKEIENAVQVFKKYKCPFELMHSVSEYPMALEHANLKVIQTLKNKFHCKVGYSGHEIGSYLVSVAAVLLGATSIERHITLSRALYGSDQPLSLEPTGIRRMVRDIRNLDKIIGDGRKTILPIEREFKKKLRQRFV
ncbi:N-acetylneuraminate synthase family protein [Candidatus Nitrosotenuis uzonensis]|uniref:N-acylneuraminate-9-phosphate synthase n=1 Tax=Candidatus Nitrosotenuis uzonensis TaxID=1407055 RepID=A0A812EXU2_9ARCH|nr:N-acetylneuraminate synthase family protein [Candidatus Nitrosotenuis uzonensis]CAE6487007.1 N-acylneuraminate-9-phosphate synthase [Candidatus Nitrosotenuis uzonensis]